MFGLAAESNLKSSAIHTLEMVSVPRKVKIGRRRSRFTIDMSV